MGKTLNLARREETEFMATKTQPLKDTNALRRLFGHYATGVTVITAPGGERGPVGLAVNSFTSLSLKPAKVLWCLDRKSPSVEAFTPGQPFCVNILKETQGPLAMKFARHGEDKFAGVDCDVSELGVPILRDALARLCCISESIAKSGDHYIIVGALSDYAIGRGNPLMFFQGQFRELSEEKSHVGRITLGLH